MLEVSGASDRVAGCLVGLAVGDALGAPVEFKRRGTFAPVTGMRAGGYFRLPAGAWTDDTAMALCLAQSLLAAPEFSELDLLERFWRWLEHGENTSTGRALGVGQNTFRTLSNFRRTGALAAPPNGNRSDGNGALMRMAPVACRYWRKPELARLIAVRRYLGSASTRKTRLPMPRILKSEPVAPRLRLGTTSPRLGPSGRFRKHWLTSGCCQDRSLADQKPTPL